MGYNNNLLDISFKTLLENSRDMVFVKNMEGRYVAASVPFIKMAGKENLDELLNKTDLEIFDDKGLAKRYTNDDKKLISEGKNLIDYIEPITDFDGRARYASTSKYILRDNDNKPIGILGVTRDITRDYIARQHYQHELKYLFELPKDTYAVSYIDVDSWRIISQRRQNINSATYQECQTVDELCEAALISIVGKCRAADFYSNFTPEYLQNLYDSGRNMLSFKYQRVMSDGSERWVHNEARFLVDVDSGHLCVMLSAKDIDAEQKEVKQLEVAAKMDKMTMLLNRETTMDSIKDILKNESKSKHVLYMIDVDNFKNINDTYGHQSGDEYLIELAKEIKTHFRDQDVVGRIGGDEFFVLMRNIPDMDIVLKKAQDILDGIKNIDMGFGDVVISGSIGISVYPDQGRTLDILYAKADGALYEAKHAGKNQFVFAK